MIKVGKIPKICKIFFIFYSNFYARGSSKSIMIKVDKISIICKFSSFSAQISMRGVLQGTT